MPRNLRRISLKGLDDSSDQHVPSIYIQNNVHNMCNYQCQLTAKH